MTYLETEVPTRGVHSLIGGILIVATMAASSAVIAADNAERMTSSRDIARLTGDWHFQIDVLDVGERENWQAPNFDRSAWAKIDVPKAWDLFDEGMWGYEGVGWYATDIASALTAKGKVQRLTFGRVNYHAKVWLNGDFLGENLNGYLPFEFDVTDKLKPQAANQLVVRVDNTARLKWLPGAKKIEWMLYGGILESVTLETTSSVFISDLAIHGVPKGTGASVECKVEITSFANEPTNVTVSATIAGAMHTPDSAKVVVPPRARWVQRLSIALPKADLWTPATPTLYTLTATIASDHQLDTLRSRFGIRNLGTRGRDLLLNGQRFVAKGVNRYDEYGKFGPCPPRHLLLDDLRRMKAAGVNMVRVHYPQSPELLSLYDEMGFVVSEEVPLNWWGNEFSGKGEEVLDEGILEQAIPALERMIQRDKNHPCIIIWSMANESQTATPIGINVMRKMIHRAKRLDESRLVTFVISASDAKMHRAFEDADLVAINVYKGVFDGGIALHASDLEGHVTKASEQYIRRQLAAFPDKPLLVTEFGVRGVRGLHGGVAYTEDYQAALNEAAWKAIRSCKEVSGGILWCWADYYHRRTFNDNGPFGSFGVVTVDRRPKAAFAALARMYDGSHGTGKQPR